MVLRALCLSTVIGLSACGGQAAEQSSRQVDDPVHGIAVELPPGWQRAAVSLTPNLTDPREVLSVATFPLTYRKTRCAHVPGSALEDLGPKDAFVTLEERGVDPGADWSDFPPRPAHFGPEQGGLNTDAQFCEPKLDFTNYWFGFTDGDRHFHVLVAFGPQATAALQRQTWQVLDSLEIDPAVRPDWRSSG